MTLKAKNFVNYEKNYHIWDRLIEKSNFHWFWSSKEFFNFNIKYLKERKLFKKDISFFVLKENIPCAFVVLVINEDLNSQISIGSYNDSPLPWPILSDEVENKEDIYDYIFKEIERRAKKYNIAKLCFSYNLNQYSKEEKTHFVNIVKKFNFVDKSYRSHLVKVNDKVNIRKSYLKNIKKNIDNYNISIMNAENFDKTFYKKYMELHIQDSGKKYRSELTYKMQFDLVKKNKGFVVQVFSKNNFLLGSLIIYHDKISAYDASVAVLNSDKENYISHIMKYMAIQYLSKINITHYELGLAAIIPTSHNIPSKKNYGISFFKEGWTNGMYKKVMVAEKYYDKLFLKKESMLQLNNLMKHYNI